MMSRPGTGTSDGRCETQFSCDRLLHRQLVVAAELELTVDDLVDRVRAPARAGVLCAAARRRAAAPLVGEDHLRPVVRERRPVPVGPVRVRHLLDATRVRRIADVDQEPVALAGAGGDVERREHGDVVAGVARRRRTPRDPGRMQRGRVGVLEDVDLPGGRVTHQPRRVDDGRVLRCSKRNTDHLDPPLRQLLVEVRRRQVASPPAATCSRPSSRRDRTPAVPLT